MAAGEDRYTLHARAFAHGRSATPQMIPAKTGGNMSRSPSVARLASGARLATGVRSADRSSGAVFCDDVHVPSRGDGTVAPISFAAPDRARRQ
jgi:hypothetical protein